MRTAFILPVLLFLLPGCVLLEDGLTGHRSRTDCSREGGRPVRDHAGYTGRGTAAADTTLWFAAVRFARDYDWQRDTAYGSVPFELLLYRDFSPVLTLPSRQDACYSPDPDRHHLLGGHLYTERAAGGLTRIGRDGAELFRFEGREFLVGLLEDGDDLLTLSRPGPERGCTLRRNGEILYRHPDGIPYGSLSDPAYGPTGALYRDGGQAVFCFRTVESGIQTFYQVRDGQAARLERVLPSTILDLRVQDGKPLALYPTLLQSRLSEGRLWPDGDAYAVTGRFSDGAGGWVYAYLDAQDLGTEHVLCGEEAVLYHSPQATFAVAAGPDGIRWYGPDGSGRQELSCRLLSPSCALAAGSRLLLALSPTDTRGHPQIRLGQRTEELDINGYVSCVGLTVSPAAN